MKKKPIKRPADVNTRMHSILADVISISNRPIKSPRKKSPRKSPG